jgi:hypothetical protein
VSRRPPDDVAQVVLRALLVWPLLGLVAVALLAVASTERFLERGPLFTLGAACGAALVAAVVDLARGAVAARAPRAAPLVVLPLVGLLSPALLLGGEYADALVGLGSSREAAQALLDRPARELLDLDVAVVATLVAAGLLVGRTPRRQAALGGGAVLLGLPGLVAAGGLRQVPLDLVLLLAFALATLAPYVVSLAGRLVSTLRGRRARLRPLQLLAASSCVVGAAIAWSFALRPGVPRLDRAAPLLGVLVCALLIARRLAPAPAPARARAGLALLLVVGLGAWLGLRALHPALWTGQRVRVELGLALGLDPVALLRRWRNPVGPGRWQERAPLPAERWDDVSELLTRLRVQAADRGDVQAILTLTSFAFPRPYTAQELAWLRAAVAAGSDEAAVRLLEATGPGGADEQPAGAVLLALPHDHPCLAQRLWEPWVNHPALRAGLEARFGSTAAAWTELVHPLDGDEGRWPNPSGSTLAALASTLRRGSVPGLTLLEVLRADPTVMEEADLARLASRPPSWPPSPELAALDLDPLDPERAPALAAAAEGDWPRVWSLTAGATDAVALRARAHHLLELLRADGRPGEPEWLARAHLRRAGPPDDAASALDLALLETVAAVCSGQRRDAADLLAALDLVMAFDGHARVAARVEALRGLVVRTFRAPDPEGVRLARLARANDLRDRAAASPSAERAKRLRGAADQLGRLR